MSDEIVKVYIPQVYSEFSKEWVNITTKAGNALHKTYGQAKSKVKNRTIRGRVITYNLVVESVEYFEKEVD